MQQSAHESVVVVAVNTCWDARSCVNARRRGDGTRCSTRCSARRKARAACSDKALHDISRAYTLVFVVNFSG